MKIKKINTHIWLIGLIALTGALVACGFGCGSSSASGGNANRYSCISGACAADSNGVYTVSNCNNVCVTTAQKYIFVTSAQYSSDLGGLAGADEKCNIAATAAGLPGTYTAWLSDNNTNAIDRITGTGPWYLVDGGTRVFNNRANLQTTPIAPINTDENGKVIGDVGVWTGTAVGGTGSGTGNCAGWTGGDYSGGFDCGEVGDSSHTDSGWTLGYCLGCGNNYSLYCLEE